MFSLSSCLAFDWLFANFSLALIIKVLLYRKTVYKRNNYFFYMERWPTYLQSDALKLRTSTTSLILLWTKHLQQLLAFPANVLILFPIKAPDNQITRKPKVFWYFQGIWHKSIGQARVKGTDPEIRLSFYR